MTKFNKVLLVGAGSGIFHGLFQIFLVHQSQVKGNLALYMIITSFIFFLISAGMAYFALRK